MEDAVSADTPDRCSTAPDGNAKENSIGSESVAAAPSKPPAKKSWNFSKFNRKKMPKSGISRHARGRTNKKSSFDYARARGEIQNPHANPQQIRAALRPDTNPQQVRSAMHSAPKKSPQKSRYKQLLTMARGEIESWKATAKKLELQNATISE